MSSPKKSSLKITLNERTLYSKSQKIPISSPKLVSPIRFGIKVIQSAASELWIGLAPTLWGWLASLGR